ncbi:hypothetical protein GCM10011450_27370 [Advenella faeciporci]|uniref:Uncharacterized protein n=1 Tax=Advenella faeciporci TaxID=797535 RepID=A0A918JQM7_9BURK|nr:hypothetical protein GCM10011450_27370 [Advenella faeciporci]
MLVLVFAPGIYEKVSDLVTGRVEHRDSEDIKYRLIGYFASELCSLGNISEKSAMF